MKILLYGMAESGLSTLFNQFKLLPNSVPLLSQNTTTTTNSSINSSSSSSNNNNSNINSTDNLNSNSSSDNNNNNIDDNNHHHEHQQQLTDNTTTTITSSIKHDDENNMNNTFSSPEEDETPSSSIINNNNNNNNDNNNEELATTKPAVPSQALKPSLSKRPTISPLQFTPPPTSNSRKTTTIASSSSSSTSPQDVFQSNNHVKFLKRRKQAFNEQFLKNLPNAFLTQLLISFKLLLHHAERKELLFCTEDKLQEFLLDRIVRDERLESNYVKNSSSNSLLVVNSSSSSSSLLISNNNNINNNNNNLNLLNVPTVTSSTKQELSSSYSDVETLIVPTTTINNNNNSTNTTTNNKNSNTKAMIAKFNGKENPETSSSSLNNSPKANQQQEHHQHNIKFESKYKGVRNDLEKILKEQQKEFIEPLKKEKIAHPTRQRSLSETLLVSQIKKLKQKRGKDGKDEGEDYSQLLPPAQSSSASSSKSTNTSLSSIFHSNSSNIIDEEDIDTSSSTTEESKQQLPAQYCEHCQKMAHAKLKVKPSSEPLDATKPNKYQYIDWKIENTKAIVERIKKITDINQLYGVRLRSEFLKDCCDLWDNHIGLQHCFHSYTIFKCPDGGNIFSSLPAIMKWIVKKYLLHMPTKCFHFDTLPGMEIHSSELGEDIATSLFESIPPEMAILLNTNFNIINSTASARDYKFKFEVPTSTNFQELKVSVTSLIPSSPNTSSSNTSSPVASPDWNILGTSFTVPHDEYSKSDSELLYPANSGLYTLSKYRASTAMNKDVISAIRPLVLEEKKKEEKEEKKSSMSPRRLLSFFKSTESGNSEQAAPPTKPEKKTTKRIKKQDTFSVFSVITMGGISPKISFLKNEWIMCCYASNMVVFTVNLCDYFKTILVKSEFSDQLNEKKKISYSLEKFEQCVNGKYFAELPIVLCFTFVDVFEQAQHYHPLTDKQKYEIEQIIQQLNPASYGQKKIENSPLNVHTKLDQKRKPWHDSCEFIIQQYIHLATAEQRRKQVRESFAVLNCIDSRKTAQVLVNDILFNEDLLANELETETSSQTTKVNDGSKSDRSHYRKPVESEKSTQPDYTQYYLRRCKTSTTSKEQPTKISKQKKSINRKGGEKLKQELTRNKRLSWSNNGSIKLKKPEENIVVLDEYANEDEETEEAPTTARRRRKNSYNCSLQ